MNANVSNRALRADRAILALLVEYGPQTWAELLARLPYHPPTWPPGTWYGALNRVVTSGRAVARQRIPAGDLPVDFRWEYLYVDEG